MWGRSFAASVESFTLFGTSSTQAPNLHTGTENFRSYRVMPLIFRTMRKHVAKPTPAPAPEYKPTPLRFEEGENPATTIGAPGFRVLPKPETQSEIQPETPDEILDEPPSEYISLASFNPDEINTQSVLRYDPGLFPAQSHRVDVTKIQAHPCCAIL